MVSCLEGDDAVFQQKAQTALTMWAYMGLPELREGTLLTDLLPTTKTTDPERFQKALKSVKRILSVRDEGFLP